MSSASKALSKIERVQVFLHFLLAFQFFMEGLDKLEHPEGYKVFIAICWATALALVALTGAFVYAKLHLHHHPRLLASIGAIEMVICGFVAIDLFRHGKTYLPYAWGFAAVLTGALAVFHLFRNPVHTPRCDFAGRLCPARRWIGFVVNAAAPDRKGPDRPPG